MKAIFLGLLLFLMAFVLINDSQLCAQKLKFPNLMPFRKQPQVEPIPLTDSKPAPLIVLPKWNLFPPNSVDTSEPTMLQRFQSSSQQFFRNSGETVSNFAHQTNNSLRRSTEQTGNFLSSLLPPPDWWNPQPKPSQMIQPPPRSAYDFTNEPKIKF